MVASENKRIYIFDVLRGISILGVIAIHGTAHEMTRTISVSDYWILVLVNQMSRFAVPAFLIISGFFMSYKEIALDSIGTQSIILKRLSRVLPPYLVWSALYFGLFVLVGTVYSRSAVQVFFEKLLIGGVTIHFFFIIVIIQFYVLSLFNVMRKGKGSRFLTTAFIVLFIAFTIPNYVILLSSNGIASTSGIAYYFKVVERSLFARWVLYFMIGRWIGGNWGAVQMYGQKHSGKLLFLTMTSFGGALCELILLRKYSNEYLLLPQDWMISQVLFGCLFTLWFVTLSDKVVNSNFMPMAKIGMVSFSIYIVHEPMLRYISVAVDRSVGQGILSHQVVVQPVLVALGLLASLSVIYGLRITLPRKLYKVMLG